MPALLPVSISIGILCGLWFQVTVWVPWLGAWVGYAAWASFYYAGGDAPALKKSFLANVAGMIQGALFFYLWTKFGGGNMALLSVIIGIYCFVMTMEGSLGLLAHHPGTVRGRGRLLRQPRTASGRHHGDPGQHLCLHADWKCGRASFREAAVLFPKSRGLDSRLKDSFEERPEAAQRPSGSRYNKIIGGLIP